MMKKRSNFRFLVAFFVLLLLFFSFWFLYLKDFEERKLINESNTVIHKIENFKNERSRLPNSLSEIGTAETEHGPIFYEKRSELDYIIYFNIGFDDVRVYYSNKQHWENFY